MKTFKKENIYLDLSKCTEGERKRVEKITGIIIYRDHFYIHFHSVEKKWLAFTYFKNQERKQELTYPEFIRLFDGGESNEVLQVENQSKTEFSSAILIEKLERENEELIRWKKEAMEVMGKIELQEVGKVLNLQIGTDISEKILPSLKKLIKENDEKKAMLEGVLEILNRKTFPREGEMNNYANKITELLNKHKTQ